RFASCRCTHGCLAAHNRAKLSHKSTFAQALWRGWWRALGWGMNRSTLTRIVSALPAGHCSNVFLIHPEGRRRIGAVSVHALDIPSIDSQIGAVDIPSQRACDEGNEISNLFDATDAPYGIRQQLLYRATLNLRHIIAPFPGLCKAARPLFPAVRHDRTGSDRVHRDPGVG